MISQQMEEYLEAIGKLEERGEPITTSALARACHVAPPTVTEMLHRLTEQGLIAYEPRKEVALTEAGRQLSSTVIRRHRLWERFLQDVLGLRWDQVHEQACLLEHATSPELERHLAQALGANDTCPHGHAIPDGDAGPAEEGLIPLSALAPAQPARIVSIQQEEGALLRHLGSHGIRPGAIVQADAAPDAGEIGLTVEGRHERLPRKEAELVRVRPLAPGEAGPERRSWIALGALEPGELGVIRGFGAGGGLIARCLALGFTPGAAVQMVQNLHGGPIIVLVRDTRVALGRGEANKVYVSRRGGES